MPIENEVLTEEQMIYIGHLLDLIENQFIASFCNPIHRSLFSFWSAFSSSFFSTTDGLNQLIRLHTFLPSLFPEAKHYAERLLIQREKINSLRNKDPRLLNSAREKYVNIVKEPGFERISTLADSLRITTAFALPVFILFESYLLNLSFSKLNRLYLWISQGEKSFYGISKKELENMRHALTPKKGTELIQKLEERLSQIESKSKAFSIGYYAAFSAITFITLGLGHDHFSTEDTDDFYTTVVANFFIQLLFLTLAEYIKQKAPSFSQLFKKNSEKKSMLALLNGSIRFELTEPILKKGALSISVFKIKILPSPLTLKPSQLVRILSKVLFEFSVSHTLYDEGIFIEKKHAHMSSKKIESIKNIFQSRVSLKTAQLNGYQELTLFFKNSASVLHYEIQDRFIKDKNLYEFDVHLKLSAKVKSVQEKKNELITFFTNENFSVESVADDFVLKTVNLSLLTENLQHKLTNTLREGKNLSANFNDSSSSSTLTSLPKKKIIIDKKAEPLSLNRIIPEEKEKIPTSWITEERKKENIEPVEGLSLPYGVFFSSFAAKKEQFNTATDYTKFKEMRKVLRSGKGEKGIVRLRAARQVVDSNGHTHFSMWKLKDPDSKVRVYGVEIPSNDGKVLIEFIGVDNQHKNNATLRCV